MTNEEAARKIIAENIYITISTASNGDPWISPVYSCYDGNYNFYWVSDKDRKHSQNIKENPKVAIAIFDTHVQEGRGRGVYIQAMAFEISDREEIKKVIAIFYPRKNKPLREPDEFMGSSRRRMYKAAPEKIWVTDEKSDDRVEVELRE